MKSTLRAAIVLGTVCTAAAALAAANIPPPPPTRAGNTVDTIWGVKVADPYRWLENGDDPKVQKWSDAENARP